VHNEAFNVGQNSENYRIRDIADIVREVVPGSTIRYAADGGPDARCYRVDCSKIARVLKNFQPHWTVRDGVEELYAAYQQQGMTVADLEGSRYLRIAHIQEQLREGRLLSDLRMNPAIAPSGSVQKEQRAAA
jgi:hypothetical protein